MPGEQLVEVRGDHLLQGHEALAIGHDHEPRQQVGHLHPCEPPLAGDRVAQEHRQVQREVRDVGERVAGVDGEGREHREDPLLEGLDEELLVVLVEVVPAGQADAVGRQGGDDLVEEEPLLALDERLDPLAHLDELLAGRAPVGRGDADPGRHLLLQTGDPDLEELVEVLAEDGQELGPLEERHGLVGRQGEHPLVEVEPGQLAVEVARRLGRVVEETLDLARPPSRPRPRAYRCRHGWPEVDGQGGLVVLLGEPEVPVEQDVLPLGVADHPLAVATELRIVGREEHQAGEDPAPELVDDLAVAEVGVDLPVGRHRAQVDDPGVGAGRFGGRGGDIRHGGPR